MDVDYDPESDSAYLNFTREPMMPGRDSIGCDTPEGVEAMVVLDWKDDKIIGLEVLDATAGLHADILAEARRPGGGTKTAD